MKLNLISPYKSIVDLNDIELPKFVVLTGINGAGKTQLLQAIAQKKVSILVEDSALPEVKFFQGALGHVWSTTFYASSLERFSIELQQKFNWFRYDNVIYPGGKPTFEKYFSADEKDILERIRKRKKVAFDEFKNIDRMDVIAAIPPEFVVKDSEHSTPDPFQLNLSKLFKIYQIAREKNDFNAYLRERKGRTDVDFLSDEEFSKMHGEPPWILANQILKSASLGYSLTTPEKYGSDEPFSVKVTSDSDGAEIPFNDLSSGERVLMSLAFALYSSELDYKYPSALLLDEPDASLHPSMAGTLIRIIQEVFVNQRGMVVMMTSHSPSTVALAPSESLYVMEKCGKRISKRNKDRCIKILTVGVPALSVEYDNRVQVFVESKHDASNYSDVYEALKESGDSEISLNFISSGSGGSGSCEQVREIVSTLRRNGNSKVYGVVDWDSKNESTDFVKVVSEKTRYSLEALVFDPLVLALYLLRESIVKPTHVGVDESTSYVKVASLPVSEFQKFVTYIASKVRPYMTCPTNSELSELSYLGGTRLVVESWYLKSNGHDLEEAIKCAFPPLKRFRNENDLKNDVIKKVVVDYPQFSPLDFMTLFSSIQNQHIS